MDGEKIYMGETSCTLPFTLNGQTGRYVSGMWKEITPASLAATATATTVEMETA